MLQSRIDNNFLHKIISELEVQAGDNSNAEEKAIKECRKTIDVMNFFADIFASGGSKVCVSLLGEGNEVISRLKSQDKIQLRLLFREAHDPLESSTSYKGKRIGELFCTKAGRGPLLELSLPSLNSRQAIDTGFARVSELLGKADRTTFEDRILSAFQWAGRATVDIRREEAFLLYMIALESLILGSKVNSEITFQLRLKIVHIITCSTSTRKQFMNRISYLYGVRSKIVHSGSFQVTESELWELRQYSKQVLITVANAKQFRDMETAEQFDSWLDEQLIS